MPTLSFLRYIFVGAFHESAGDGSVGGQLYACKSLLHSPLSNHIDWLLLDSTMEALPPPPIRRRFVLAGKRLTIFMGMIRQPSVTGALIFTSAGLSFLEKGLMVLLTRAFGKRAILSPRSGLILDDLKRSALMRKFISIVLRNCHTIMCQSQGWQRLYQSISGLPDDRFVVTPNWLDAQALANFSSRSVRSDPVSILYMGWLEHYKGIYDLIEAANRYRDQLAGSSLVICGRGSQLDSAKEQVAALGLTDLFDFRGWVTGSDKLAILQQADIFVLPSYREGLPNALLEAMAAGLAVVATRVGGVPEVLVNDTLGILIDPGDIEALGQAVLRLKNDPQRRHCLGQNARAYVLAHHDINTVWPNLLRVLQTDISV